MMCHECHRREAAIRVEREVDGVREEVHLCVQCARIYLEDDSTPLEQHRVNDLLQDVRDQMDERQSKSGEKELTCPNCYLTLSMYRKTGLLGCPDCYDTFKAHLKRDLRRRHGTTRLIRQRITLPDTRPDIRKQLDQAVKHENYEQAARLRDQLKREDEDHVKSLDRVETPDRSSLD